MPVCCVDAWRAEAAVAASHEKGRQVTRRKLLGSTRHGGRVGEASQSALAKQEGAAGQKWCLARLRKET
jgi:hypothetical protein